MLYALYAEYVTRLDDVKIRRQMQAGGLEQIIEHVDRIERDLAEVYLLVTRMQHALAAEPGVAGSAASDLGLSRDGSATSACWDGHRPIEEDSSSL